MKKVRLWKAVRESRVIFGVDVIILQPNQGQDSNELSKQLESNGWNRVRPEWETGFTIRFSTLH